MTSRNGPLFANQNNYSNGPYPISKKNHPSHVGHVKLNLSKMTKGGFFNPCPNDVLLPKLLV